MVRNSGKWVDCIDWAYFEGSMKRMVLRRHCRYEHEFVIMKMRDDVTESVLQRELSMTEPSPSTLRIVNMNLRHYQCQVAYCLQELGKLQNCDCLLYFVALIPGPHSYSSVVIDIPTKRRQQASSTIRLLHLTSAS